MHDDKVLDAAARGVEAFDLIVKERGELRHMHDRMTTDIAMMREKIDQLESRLSTATIERDHYMKFATELVGGLNVIQSVINDQIKAAAHGPYKPSRVRGPTKLPAVSLADTTVIEDLVKRLPLNGGESSATA